MLNIDDRLIREVSPKIGPNALSVLLAISIHLNQKTNRCFPSHYTLMQLTGLGKNTVYDALNVLKNNGLLVVEQSVNSDKKQFGKRTFLINTKYIGVFISAKDLEPLPNSREPESREPESREPESREPETWETYQINNVQQINQFEQINKVGVETPAPFALEAKHFDFNSSAAAPNWPELESLKDVNVQSPHIRDFVNADTPPQLYERISAFYATDQGRYEIEAIMSNTIAGKKTKEQFQEISREFSAHAIKVGLGRGTFVDVNAAFHQWWGRQKRFDTINTTINTTNSKPAPAAAALQIRNPETKIRFAK